MPLAGTILTQSKAVGRWDLRDRSVSEVRACLRDVLGEAGIFHWTDAELCHIAQTVVASAEGSVEDEDVSIVWSWSHPSLDTERLEIEVIHGDDPRLPE